VKSCFECVEETSAKDDIVKVVHVHYIESYVFSAGIAEATKRYWQRYGAYWFDSSPSKPYNGFDASFNYFLSKPICLKAERNRISS
jgi:hypothetical protein